MAPSEHTRRLQRLDARHHVHPFTNQRELARRGSRVIVRGEGCWLVDSEGRRLLDGMAGLWCVNIGYGRARLAEAAAAQMRTLPYYNTFFNSTTEPAAELAARLAGITPPGLDRFLFTGSGSEANDSVVKLVRWYWNRVGRPEKKLLVSRELSYHGTTLASASLSGLSNMHAGFDLPLDGFVHVPTPYAYGQGDLDPDTVGTVAALALEQRILELGPERVAAFVAEPVQGAGGVIVPPASYWPEVQRVCREHDVLLVADEVVCGFGRTGRWFGSQTFDIAPDLLTMAKGLSSGYQPIAAVALGPRVGEAVFESDVELVHGFTYAGHPVACAVALENLAIMEEEGLHERASGPIGNHFRRALESLADHPMVGEVRTCGLLGAIELVAERDGPVRFAPERRIGIACRERSLEEGLVMRAVRDIMVLAPPLVITESEIDELARRAARAIERTWEEVVRAG